MNTDISARHLCSSVCICGTNLCISFVKTRDSGLVACQQTYLWAVQATTDCSAKQTSICFSTSDTHLPWGLQFSGSNLCNGTFETPFLQPSFDFVTDLQSVSICKQAGILPGDL